MGLDLLGFASNRLLQDPHFLEGLTLDQESLGNQESQEKADKRRGALIGIPPFGGFAGPG